MSRFLNKLIYRQSTEIVDGEAEEIITLTAGLAYSSDILGRGVFVPSGFKSDGASVPRRLWGWFPPFGKYLRAAVVHDYFCVTHNIDSVTAAKVFREAMEACGVGKVRRNLMYSGVRIGGPRFSSK